MSTVEQIGTLPGFEAFPHPREGHTMVFSGYAPNANGEPTGEYVQVELTVPPISFFQLKRFNARPVKSEPDLREDSIDIVQLSLERNYRGVPRWLVEQSLDGPALNAINAKLREMAE